MTEGVPSGQQDLDLQIRSLLLMFRRKRGTSVFIGPVNGNLIGQDVFSHNISQSQSLSSYMYVSQYIQTK